MDYSLMLFHSRLVFVELIAEITEDLALRLVAMLIGYMPLKARRVDVLETEAALSLTHLVCNSGHQPNHNYSDLVFICNLASYTFAL
jgi:hypothetical protein